MRLFIRPAVIAATPLLVLVAASNLFATNPDSQLLATSANIPLKVTATASGGLDIEAGTGKTLKECKPYLASRGVGTQAWVEEPSTYQVISQDKEKIVLEARFTSATATVTLQRSDAGRYHLSGRLASTTSRPIELARFHYLDGLVSDRSLNLLSMRQFELPGRIVKSSEKLPSPRAACQKGWGGVHWPRLAEPIHDAPDTAISGDTGMLATDWNSAGFFLGFTGPGAAFGELGIRTARETTPFFAAVLLDAVRLDPGTSRPMENAILSFGDPQDELRHWAVTCRDTLGPARVRPPMVGYCSWYQKGQGVQPADIRHAIDAFAPYEAPPGGRTIQIDDGFQVCPGDWSGRGEWAAELKKLPREISDKGFIPGIWVAPTAIQATHPIVKEHPEWLQRDATGAFCVRFHNWRSFQGMTGVETYFLEPDHPGARKFIADTLRHLRADGWRYFKIDFAYTVSSARVKYDPHKTTYESLRDQWRLFREALGEDALLNSCNGGMWRYTLGTVDVSRIGGDIGGKMSTLRRNLSEMMLRSHVNGIWYQADPDVFYMRGAHSQLNFEQSHLLTATQGLLGTALLTSDFADQWSPQAAGVVRRYWNKTGPRVPAMQHIILNPDGVPAALSAAYDKGEYAIGLYNWGMQAADVSISLEKLRLPGGADSYSATSGFAEKITLADDILTISQQPGESMRIVTLRAKSTR
jgi:hypothetical protein